VSGIKPSFGTNLPKRVKKVAIVDSEEDGDNAVDNDLDTRPVGISFISLVI